MGSYTPDAFAKSLLTESLFYDEEFGAIGTVSLIDEISSREMFISAYVPDEGAFVIEASSDWESVDEVEIDEIGYALATDSDEHGVYDFPEQAAEELLKLASTYDLHPSLTLIFETEE